MDFLLKHHAMETYGEVEVYVQSFGLQAEVSNHFTPRRLTLEEILLYCPGGAISKWVRQPYLRVKRDGNNQKLVMRGSIPPQLQVSFWFGT